MKAAGGEAVLTRPDHPSGSDRIFEALGKIDPDAFIPVIRQLISDALGTDISPHIVKHKLQTGAVENAIAEQAPENNQPEGPSNGSSS